MTPSKIEKTKHAEDLEEVEVRPRQNRGAVISVRLTADEAQRLAEAASRTGLSVSELARRTIRQAIYTPWRLAGFGSASAPVVIVGMLQFTGGDYAQHHRTEPATAQWPDCAMTA
jgi:hypothetical protein